MYSFKRLIKKYSRPTVVHGELNAGEWIDGKWIEGEPSIETINLAIIPFDVKAVAQLGGQVKMGDGTIYSLSPLTHGTKIEQNSGKYTVDTSGDFTMFADFYRYIAKGVSSFD